MFINQRYTTSGVTAKIPGEIILGLWIAIDNRRSYGAEMDYLQVFELFKKGDEQKIIHSQEQPEYSFEMVLPFLAPPVDDIKVFIIDNGKYSTMMLAEEY